MNETTITQQQTFTRTILKFLLRIPLVYYVLVVIFIIASLSQPEAFTKWQTIRNIIVNSTALGIVTVGQTSAMLVAGIDLSIGAVMSLTTVITALLMESNPEFTIGIVLLCIAIGILIGIINGFGAAYLKLNPLILTLATGIAIQGIALHILYAPGGLVTRDFRQVARGSLFNTIPFPAIYLLMLYIVGTYILKRTSFGLSLYAVGGNEDSARLSGLRATRIQLAAYVISGLLAALGGLFLAARIGSGDPLSGDPFTMDSITAAVLGGTSLMGGVGDLWSGLAGVFILGTLSTMLNMNNVNPFWQWVIKGAILIGALAVNHLRQQIFNRIARLVSTIRTRGKA